MSAPSRRPDRRGRVPAILLAAFAILLALAGGASRADTLGQPVLRLSAGLMLAALVLLRPDMRLRRHKGPLLILAAATTLAAVQLLPLPPALWTALPGRAPFAGIAALAGLDQPWRPLSIVPDATVNALFSLLVPAAVLALLAALPERDRRWIAPGLLCLVTVSVLVALAQLTSDGVSNRFINATEGDPSGLFANRNHQGLFLACGILLAPAWVLARGWQGRMPTIVLAGGIVFLLLMVLATGSRAGLALSALALPTGLAIGLAASGRRLSVGRGRPLLAGAAVLGAVLLGVSMAAHRARALDRFLSLDAGEDMRVRAAGTVWSMVRDYFPWGGGYGAFDPLFRIAEPDRLLKPTFFNHAHNDYAELALTGGVPALLLLLAAVAWWARASWAVWRAPGGSVAMAEGRVGSAAIGLVLLASAVDYPTRTPLVMALLAVWAVWLGSAAHMARRGG